MIVDVQNDFISGSLAIINCPAKQDGEDVVEPINYLLDTVQELFFVILKHFYCLNISFL